MFRAANSTKPTWRVRTLAAALILPLASLSAIQVISQDVAQSSLVSGASSAFVFRTPSKSKQKRYFASSAFRSKRSSDFAASRTRVSAQAQANYSSGGRVRLKPLDESAVSSLKDTSSPAGMQRASDVYTGVGERHLEDGKLDEALGAFEKAIELNPRNTNAVLGLSEALARKGRSLLEADDVDGAVASFKASAERDPKNAAAYAGLGTAYEREDRLPDAVWNYERALAIDPTLSEIYPRLGSVHLKQGDFERADEWLQKAVLADPQNTDAMRDLAFAELKRGETSAALERLRRLVQSNPKSAELRYLLGAALAESGRDGDASAEYQRALALDPSYTPALYDTAVDRYNDGRFAEAAEVYEKVLENDSENAAAKVAIGDAYSQLGEFEKASQSYEAATADVKDDADVYTKLGYTLGRQERWDDAVAALTTASEIAPDSATNSNLGWAYYNSAEVDAEAGRTDDAAKKFGLAKEILSAVVGSDGTFVAALLNLGSTLNRLGDFQGAAGHLLRASELKRDWLPALSELGVSYRKLGKLTDAIGRFQRVVDLNERFEDALFNLGEAQSAAGLKGEAQKTLKRLRAVDPEAASRLESAIEGKLREKIDQVNPVNRIPKLPF